jgi:hypothetical protein
VLGGGEGGKEKLYLYGCKKNLNFMCAYDRFRYTFLLFQLPLSHGEEVFNRNINDALKLKVNLNSGITIRIAERKKERRKVTTGKAAVSVGFS